MEHQTNPTSIIGWCPACDEGNLHAVKLSGLTAPATLCEECEALWLGDETPNAESFSQLSRYMRKNGETTIQRITKHPNDTTSFEPW